MPKKRETTQVTERALENKLLENMVHLQKVHTELIDKFDKLAKEISSLLGLFELSARNFAKQPGIKVGETDREFLDKIDKLLEQNKTIAKGLTLMEEQMKKRVGHVSSEVQPQQSQETSEYSPSMMRSSNRPLPKF